MHLQRKQNMTLVELLLVVFIVGILAALLLNAVSGSWEGAKKTKAVKLANEVAKATELYIQEFGRVPPILTTDSPTPTSTSMDACIYTYLTGEGDGKLWDNRRKKAVKAPLSFGGNMFDSNDHLLSPWETIFKYRPAGNADIPAGAPPGLTVYVFTADEDGNIFGNWGSTQ
ncbi:MAG: type II secretion system protein [Planctomycetota bacterium]|jgi:type II secretory pathway pseudopilin PulG